jgi:type I restriction enzyme S subunit
VKCIDDEIPFEIPQSWCWVRFGSLVIHNPQVTADDEANAAFMPMTLIDAGYGSRYTYETKKWGTIKTGFTKIATGDIAYAKITPCFQNRKSFILGEVPGGVAAATTELNVIRTYAGTLDGWYILYFLKSEYFIKEARYKGTAGQQRVLSDYVQNKLVPLPPLNEQKRIVQKIQEALPIVRIYGKSQEALDKLNADIFDKLKKSVLQEAIQGKLVPQDPNDESASVLLERIKAEKAKLFTEGKLKKKDLVDSVIFKGDDNKYYEKVGSEINCIDDEIPFEIPSNWQWVRLGKVTIVNPRNTISDEMSVGFIPMTNISPGYGNSIECEQRYWKDVKSGFTHIADGDVAFAKITPCFQNRKSFIAANLPNGFAAGTTELNVLRPYDNTIDTRYLLWFLKSEYFISEAKFKGTAGQQRVVTDYVLNRLFPLPPVKEQIRISNHLEFVIASIMR